MSITKAVPADAGCWIDGHWGQYGIARMVDLAQDYGYDDAELTDYAARHLASSGPSNKPPITDDEHQALSDGCDEVESWLNANVAPDGYSFGWSDGEFFLASADFWYAEAES